MRLLITFIRSYPRQSAVLLTALLLAGVAEGASLSALLPRLSFAISLIDASDRVYVLEDGRVTRAERNPAGTGLLRETTNSRGG